MNGEVERAYSNYSIDGRRPVRGFSDPFTRISVSFPSLI
jgi:hypothetical protein